MSLTIETGDQNQILRKKSEVVFKIDDKLIDFIEEMKDTMKENKGIGLAAPQVGLNKRVIVVLLDNKKMVPMINPRITSHSEKTVSAEEGCLSLPGQWGQVRRYQEITVEYTDEKGDAIHTLDLKDFNARVVQHEIDHLDGVLFTDYIEPTIDTFNVAQNREIEML
jgi:peptide deformylase